MITRCHQFWLWRDLRNAQPRADGERAVVAGGGLGGLAADREEEVGVEAVEVGVEEGQARRDRALRLAELASELLRFRKEKEECGRAGLVPRLRREREALHDLGER